MYIHTQTQGRDLLQELSHVIMEANKCPRPVIFQGTRKVSGIIQYEFEGPKTRSSEIQRQERMMSQLREHQLILPPHFRSSQGLRGLDGTRLHWLMPSSLLSLLSRCSSLSETSL